MKTEKQSVWIFPEGTRSYTAKPDMLPFKKGAFHLAVQAGVPIVPVVTANYSEVLHLQSWTFKGGSVPVKGEFIFVLAFGFGVGLGWRSQEVKEGKEKWNDEACTS